MRARARWGITPLLAAPLGAWALGLGDIELQSALNQPFQAEIALVSATPEELRELRVALAENDTFARYGLDRAGFLSSFDFRVTKDRAGRDVIRVSSRQSITEPFVTMLIEASHSRGRILREYTVLLDPPLFLPQPAAPAAVQPAQTRPPAAGAAAGPIDRPATSSPAPASSPSSTVVTPAPRPAPSTDGTYGPVQRAETLWAIAERFRPAGVSMNQMMVAMYQANPQAFAGNMNLLQIGAVLRIPAATDLQSISGNAATAEVQRQIDEWQGRPPQARLVLVPPSETPAPAPVPAPQPRPAPAPGPTSTPSQAPSTSAADAEQARRLLEIRDEELQALQQQSGADETSADPVLEGELAAGVDLESEQLFVDDAEEPAPESVEVTSEPVPAPAPRIVVASEPSLVERVLGWLMAPVLWISLGVGALLLTALWFVRRRRQEPEDVTGRWEALESEVDDDEVREATERMRRRVPDESFVVEEQTARPRRAEPDVDLEDEAPPRPRAARAERAAAPAQVPVDETLSSQTVINLDQADAIAEADFHMAYGLYDQAAELVSKALEATPDRRDLKLKLLEVFFVWGNKDSFLGAAKALRQEMGGGPDADWDKVVIMGKQICPDEALFAQATAAASHVDLDLDAGDSPALDLAFDEVASDSMDFDLSEPADDTLEASSPRAAATARARPERDDGDSLDIGERTAAGLEAALFLEEHEGEVGTETAPGLDFDIDSLAVTQESPTVERPGASGGWQSLADSPTAEIASVDAPTVETPTIETAGPDAPTTETPTLETTYRNAESPTVEQFGIANTGDHTAEIDLDDLGLDVQDLEGLPGDLGDLPAAAGADTDTRRQPVLQADDEDELLSATGVTQVLRGDEDDDFEQRNTAVLPDDDATMLAPGFDDSTMTGTAVLESRFEFDEQSGDTSLVKALGQDDGLDLNLDDLSAALQGGDTIEQPRSSPFSGDVFGGNGQTPVDLDVGIELLGTDDPTGTEEVSPLDPQTMTEIGTKLDLARAYIDMGDPEGARSILEEVLDEGDPGQRREAQSLIDVLSP